MKILVSYSELVSGPGYNNCQTKAEIQLEVNGDINTAFDKAWRKCKQEVQKQLFSDIKINDDLPF